MKTLRMIGAVVLLGMGASAANATTGYCNDGGTSLAPIQTDGLSVGDFQYRGGNANNCYGVVAGNDGNALPANLFGVSSWDFLAKYDFGDANPNTNDSFDLDGIPGGDSIAFSLAYLGLDNDGFHQYELNAIGNPGSILPAFIDLVGLVKQGGQGASDGGWAAYFFDGALVDSDGNVGRFRTVFGPGNPAANDFSHFSFFGANYIPCGDDCGDEPLPEPGTLALLGLGLIGLGASRRRKLA